MDATNYPDVLTMTVEEARAYILEALKRAGGDTHDIEIDGLARNLEEAAIQRERAESMMRGGRSQSFYGSGQSPAAQKTEVLYEAAWALVMEGILRPGPRHFGALNQRESGYCLTEKGKVMVGQKV